MIPPIAKCAMDGAPGDDGLVMEEQATASATAGPSTSRLAKCARHFAQDDKVVDLERRTQQQTQSAGAIFSASRLKLEANGELELTASERGGWLAKERRTEGSDVAGEVGVVENVESGDTCGQDFCFVSLVFGEAKVVVVEKVERGYSAALKSVAANACRTGVAEAGVIVVVAGGFVVGRT